METFYRSPLEHDKEYITYLGLISARWAMTEEAICNLFSNLIGAKETGRNLYLSLGSFRQRIELVKAAVNGQIKSRALQEKALKALADAYDAFKARNKIVHSPYHAVMRSKRNAIFSVPHLNSQGEIQWLGQGHPNQPERINKGVFKNHLEKLDRILGDIVDVMHAAFDHKVRLAKRRAQRRRKTQSAPRLPQARKAQPLRPRSSRA